MLEANIPLSIVRRLLDNEDGEILVGKLPEPLIALPLPKDTSVVASVVSTFQPLQALLYLESSLAPDTFDKAFDGGLTGNWKVAPIFSPMKSIFQTVAGKPLQKEKDYPRYYTDNVHLLLPTLSRSANGGCAVKLDVRSAHGPHDLQQYFDQESAPSLLTLHLPEGCEAQVRGMSQGTNSAEEKAYIKRFGTITLPEFNRHFVAQLRRQEYEIVEYFASTTLGGITAERSHTEKDKTTIGLLLFDDLSTATLHATLTLRTVCNSSESYHL